jgi:DNA-binding NarL/FixJ family response regulator
MTQLRLMLVDDHAAVRAGFRRLLEDGGDLQVVAEHGSADAAYTALLAAPARSIDVLVLDLSMPGRSGLELLRRLALRLPWLRVLVFSMHDGLAGVRQCLAAGARGYVTKSSEPELLANAVRRVARGETALSPDVAAAAAGPGPAAAHERLSPREFDILLALLQGQALERIAAALCLSVKTVANNQALIRRKLGVANAAELLRYAREHRLVGA